MSNALSREQPVKCVRSRVLSSSVNPPLLPDPSAILPSSSSSSDLTHLCIADQIPPRPAVPWRRDCRGWTSRWPLGPRHSSHPAAITVPRACSGLPSGLPVPAPGHRRHPQGVAQLSGPLVWLLPYRTRGEVRRHGIRSGSMRTGVKDVGTRAVTNLPEVRLRRTIL